MVSSESRRFIAGDLVLLQPNRDRSAAPILTRPLKQGKEIHNQHGVIRHDDIIGQRVRDIIVPHRTRSTPAGVEYRLHEVSLEDYARLSKRLVTPVYPADANLIVSLLDLHPASADPGRGDEPSLEILEAGTGHGALTLHLSRAIHAANSPHMPAREDGTDDEQSGAVVEWKARRRAIIHSVEASARYSKHAEAVVRGFRHGMYADNVDFHVGDVSRWVTDAVARRGGRPFLTHASLDLPSAEAHVRAVCDALVVDGALIVFNPSITQILDCAKKVKDDRIPLDLDKVLELGVNGSSAAREWDVRFTRPRALHDSDAPPSSEHSSPLVSGLDEDPIDGDPQPMDLEETDSDPSPSQPHRPFSIVCRPKVGKRIIGGGFVGLWKRKRE